MYIDIEKKYAPQSITDFVFANDEVELMVKSYITGNNKRPLLMYGRSGTGKSALAQLIPNAIEGEDAAIYKIKAAEINNAEGLKKLENQKVFSMNGLFGNKVMNYCVIEEYEKKLATIDSLKVLLDDYKNMDLTIFTSNHIQKVDSAIKSRCKTINIPPAPPIKFLPLASKILKSERINLAEDVLLSMLEDTYRKYADNRKYYEELSDFIFQVNLRKNKSAA